MGESIHFIGIGGAGMSAIAWIFMEMGYEVSGSDLKESDTTVKLASRGARIHIGHRAENIEGAGSVVVSSAVPEDNPELVAARARRIPVFQRAEMLGRLMKRGKGIAVAGTHGKTTTTSMISVVLEKAGKDPTVLVGGELNDIGGNAKLGRGEYVVAEADESDGSFLKLHPQVAVVTNIETDHLDHYPGLDEIVGAFKGFLELLPPDGVAVLCADDPQAAALASSNRFRTVTYGLGSGADYRAEDIRQEGTGSTYRVTFRGEPVGQFRLRVPGRHNVLNSLAAVAVGRLAGADVEGIARGLEDFSGVRRRFQVLGKAGGITVVDDYGHHPTEVRATLEAARGFTEGRLICVFQPHRYTRTKFLGRDFAGSFAAVDRLILTEVYSAGERPIEGVSSRIIAEAVRERTGIEPPVVAAESVPAYVLEMARPGDLIITMGAGDIWKAGETIVQMLRAGTREESLSEDRVRTR